MGGLPAEPGTLATRNQTPTLWREAPTKSMGEENRVALLFGRLNVDKLENRPTKVSHGVREA
jgi:hypothetical protein